MDNELSKRLLEFSSGIVNYIKPLPNKLELVNIKKQILKSATSTAANYQESQGGCTRKDFHNKISISLKEIKETRYWLDDK